LGLYLQFFLPQRQEAPWDFQCSLHWPVSPRCAQIPFGKHLKKLHYCLGF
jgi:hypothetical protein